MKRLPFSRIGVKAENRAPGRGIPRRAGGGRPGILGSGVPGTGVIGIDTTRIPRYAPVQNQGVKESG